MTTTEIISKAMKVMDGHDWWWCFADYTHPDIDYARGSMREFVELVATIQDAAVRNAMRELWVATYENVHANMFHDNEEASKAYETKKAELMKIIRPCVALAA